MLVLACKRILKLHKPHCGHSRNQAQTPTWIKHRCKQPLPTTNPPLLLPPPPTPVLSEKKEIAPKPTVSIKLQRNGRGGGKGKGGEGGHPQPILAEIVWVVCSCQFLFTKNASKPAFSTKLQRMGTGGGKGPVQIIKITKIMIIITTTINLPT